jgi:hypothetical protein
MSSSILDILDIYDGSALCRMNSSQALSIQDNSIISLVVIICADLISILLKSCDADRNINSFLSFKEILYLSSSSFNTHASGSLYSFSNHALKFHDFNSEVFIASIYSFICINL